MPAVGSPDRHRRRLHEVSAGRTEGARNSISLVQPPYHAEPEITTRTCAFAHRLFPGLPHRRPRRTRPARRPLIDDVPAGRGLRCPPEDWGATVVLWRSRMSPSHTAVPDPPDGQL